MVIRAFLSAALCSVIAGCSTLLPNNASLLEPASLLPAPDTALKDSNGSEKVDSTFKQFVDAAEAAKGSADKAVLGKYVSKGVNLSDQQCDAWLDALSHQNTDIEFGTGLFNIGSNTLVAAMGLAQSSAAAISSVGMASGAVNATAQQYRSSILFTPDFALLHKKISDGKVDARKQILSNAYEGFDEATRDLIAYDRICSRDSITLILKKSVEISKFEIPGLAKAAASTEAEAQTGKPGAVAAQTTKPTPPAAPSPAKSGEAGTTENSSRRLLQDMPSSDVFPADKGIPPGIN